MQITSTIFGLKSGSQGRSSTAKQIPFRFRETVTDTVSGTAKNYSNRQGQIFKPVLDVDAFATCE